MMKKTNIFMIFQWLIFLPLILPLAVITGAFDGIKKVLIQASDDIFEEKATY